MGVDVDQARGDELTACIDGIRGIGPNVGVDRGDFARDDRHVADGIEPDRWIDHAPAFDDQIIGCRRQIASAGEHRSSSSGCADELAPIHHGPPEMVCRNRRSIAPNAGSPIRFAHALRSAITSTCSYNTAFSQRLTAVLCFFAWPYRRKSRRPPDHRPSILWLLTIKPIQGRVIFGSVKLIYFPTSLVVPSRRASMSPLRAPLSQSNRR
jgi:hypothetical protein